MKSSITFSAENEVTVEIKCHRELSDTSVLLRVQSLFVITLEVCVLEVMLASSLPPSVHYGQYGFLGSYLKPSHGFRCWIGFQFVNMKFEHKFLVYFGSVRTPLQIRFLLSCEACLKQADLF